MDPRVKPLEDAAARAIVDTNYDPHFSGVRARAYHETLLFLARFDALMAWYRKIDKPLGWRPADDIDPAEPAPGRRVPAMPHPIPMILFCPSCGVQHIDRDEPHTSSECNLDKCVCGAWQNPPHRSHLCANCGHVWRPADAPTEGVAEIATRGQHDHEPIRGNATTRLTKWRHILFLRLTKWRHKKTGRIETEIGRGELQMSWGNWPFKEGDRLVAYCDEDGSLWFRLEQEFEDGRFEKLAD